MQVKGQPRELTARYVQEGDQIASVTLPNTGPQLVRTVQYIEQYPNDINWLTVERRQHADPRLHTYAKQRNLRGWHVVTVRTAAGHRFTIMDHDREQVVCRMTVTVNELDVMAEAIASESTRILNEVMGGLPEAEVPHTYRKCWAPGDQEHDHAMCEDVVAELSGPEDRADTAVEFFGGVEEATDMISLPEWKCSTIEPHDEHEWADRKHVGEPTWYRCNGLGHPRMVGQAAVGEETKRLPMRHVPRGVAVVPLGRDVAPMSGVRAHEESDEIDHQTARDSDAADSN